MPAIVHLVPRFIEDGPSNGITATGIGLIVGVGIIPAIVLMWVCCWLMICYPHDRTCWCAKSRKRKAREDLGEKGNPIAGDNTLDEKQNYAVNRPATNHRMESGSSNGSGRLSKAAPPRPLQPQQPTRMSVQSVGSDRTMAFQQEPQRFV